MPYVMYYDDVIIHLCDIIGSADVKYTGVGYSSSTGGAV